MYTDNNFKHKRAIYNHILDELKCMEEANRRYKSNKLCKKFYCDDLEQINNTINRLYYLDLINSDYKRKLNNVITLLKDGKSWTCAFELVGVQKGEVK